jgi:hypothetical protein
MGVEGVAGAAVAMTASYSDSSSGAELLAVSLHSQGIIGVRILLVLIVGGHTSLGQSKIGLMAIAADGRDVNSCIRTDTKTRTRQ